MASLVTDDNFTGCLDFSRLPFLGKEEKEEVANIKKHGFDFSREGDFNYDGIRDKALAGVYRDKSGQLGNFLLVITERASKRWRKEFLVKISSEKLAETHFCLFSTLSGSGKKGDFIEWSSCLHCDTTYILIWENGKYNLKYFGDYLPKAE